VTGKQDFDVLIVGAGAAGLNAGRLLTAAGLKVALVEARNRIGGRIFTRHEPVPGFGNVSLELGAEFVHGLPSSSWNLIREARLSTYELDGSQLRFEESRLQPCGQERGQTFEIIEAMSRWLNAQGSNTDMSFAEYLRVNRIDGPNAQQAAAYVEGFNAADHNIAGIAGLARQQRAEDSIQGDRIFHLRDGYEALPQFLCREFMAQGGTLLMNHAVTHIRWQRGQVAMTGHGPQGATFALTARQLVSTLPLGVVQARKVLFDPPATEFEMHAARMAMGCVHRVSLLFTSAFWREPEIAARHAEIADELHSLSFLFAQDTHWPTWWTSAPEVVPAITAWMGGPRAFALGAEDLPESAIGDLARIFGESTESMRGRLVSAHSHDWQTDPYSLGAYSYVPAGALDASERMTEPAAGTLFFAGEHTDLEGRWGTVHAALDSGQRAATQLLRLKA
jgi:monoamine oxidase